MSCLCGSRGSEGRLRGSTSRAERSCSILRRGNAGDIHQISIRGRVRRLIKPTNVATGQQSMYSLMPRKRGSRLGWGLDRSLRRLFKPTFCGWNVFLLCKIFHFHSLTPERVEIHPPYRCPCRQCSSPSSSSAISYRYI